MHKLRTYIISLFLLGVFLIPSIVNVFHHHENAFICSAKNEKNYHVYHEKCSICSFHFSIYTSEQNHFHSIVNIFYSKIIYKYFSANFIKSNDFSFLLRAPPVYRSCYASNLAKGKIYCLIFKS